MSHQYHRKTKKVSLAQGQAHTEKCSSFWLGWRVEDKNSSSLNDRLLLSNGACFNLSFPQQLLSCFCWVSGPTLVLGAQTRTSKRPECRAPTHQPAAVPCMPLHTPVYPVGGRRAPPRVTSPLLTEASFWKANSPSRGRTGVSQKLIKSERRWSCTREVKASNGTPSLTILRTMLRN